MGEIRNMEIKQKFDVKEEDNKVHIIQETTRIMSKEEALKELTKIESDHNLMKKQEMEIMDAIEKKKWDETLIIQRKSLSEIEQLRDHCKLILESYILTTKEDIKSKVRKEKITRGYKRIKSNSEKIAVQNQILGPILAEMDLDMGLPIIREIKLECVST